MTVRALESAHLFTPGRASYITSNGGGEFALNLTEASAQRAEVAAHLFDEHFHTVALFAGGYPGIAQNWPSEHTPAIGNREADLMAAQLEAHLRSAGWSDESVAARVKRQGDSNNSIGDVLVCLEKGLLDPNDFHDDDHKHGIHLISGALHAARFRAILAKGLDIDKSNIVRAKIRDQYGTPATEFRAKESSASALAKEYGAIAITILVLKDVRPGNFDDLRDAELRFNTIASKA